MSPLILVCAPSNVMEDWVLAKPSFGRPSRSGSTALPPRYLERGGQLGIYGGAAPHHIASQQNTMEWRAFFGVHQAVCAVILKMVWNSKLYIMRLTV